MFNLLTATMALLVPLTSLMTRPEYKKNLQHGENAIVSVRFLRDGNHLVSASFDGTVVLWDLPKMKRIWTVDLDKETKTEHSYTISEILDMDLSPDERTIAIGYHRSRVVGETLQGKSEYRIRLLDATNGLERRVLLGHEGLVGEIVFSPDGKLLASESGDKTARLWNVSTGKQLVSIDLRERGAAISFSPDGKFVAVGVHAGTDSEPVGLYEAETGRLVASFPPARRNVVGVTFLPNSHLLAVASNDASAAQVDVWDITENKLKRTIKDDSGITFSPDGRLRASSGSLYEHGIVVVRDVTTNEKRVTRRLPADLSASDFSSDSKTLAVGTEKGQIVLIPV